MVSGFQSNFKEKELHKNYNIYSFHKQITSDGALYPFGRGKIDESLIKATKWDVEKNSVA